MKAVFFILLLLALFGNVRIGTFILNRSVFGNRREDALMRWMLTIIPPLILGMSSLYWFAWRETTEQRLSAVGLAGWAWLLMTASVGLYWMVDRAFHNWNPERVPGTRELEGEIVRLRKAHVPFALLRRLGAHNDLYDLEITRHQVVIDDLPPAFEGYRVAFLTDTHVASFMRRAFYRECVDQVRRRRPDLVLLGGDYVSFRRHIPLMAELLLTGLEARDGVWAVLGNHDYWSDPDGIIAAMTSRGVRFLVNRSVQIERGGSVIDVVGIDEIYRGRPDPEAAFANADRRRPCLAVSHHPDVVGRLRNRRVDLLVCGHTHGGQIRFPFFGAVVVPSKHEARYAAGFHLEEDVRMYVSRGLGSIPPIRILCRPEIAVFDLVRS
ncbi:MAG TPA: metallophosphoesterase [Thermoanaerobaculia bacterium]|nr:metallophosphoesterase [Thermoanaerobaculia bacterium]